LFHCFIVSSFDCFIVSSFHCFSASLFDCFSASLFHCFIVSLLHRFIVSIVVYFASNPCFNRNAPSMSSSPTSAARFAPLAALRFRDFRLLWLGQLISLAGSQMRIVAVDFHVYQLAQRSGGIDPAVALGLIGLARVLALLLVAPLSGLIADRAERRMIIVVTSLVALLTSAGLAFATQFEFVSIWVIYLMVLLAAVAGAFELPARQAIIPMLVPAEVLPNALSINIIAWQLATVLGPSLAGVLLAYGGIATVYWIDAASFLAVVASALLMKRYAVAGSMKRAGISEALEGLRFVFRHRMIASTMLLDFVATFFGASRALLPIFADQVLKVGVVELGWLYSAPAVGAVLVASFLSFITFRRQGPVLLIAVALFGVCVAIFATSTWLPLTLLALAGTGATDTVSMVIRGTIRQLMTPDELRGRMVAVNMVFFAGGPQLGEFQAGLLSSLIGAPLAVCIGGIACVAFVAGMAARVPELRRYDGP
jgi:MFS family permease